MKKRREYIILVRRELLFCQLIKIDNYKFKTVEQITTILTEKKIKTNKVEARIQAGNKSYYGLAKLFKSRAYEESKNNYICYTIILYGSETWSLRQMDKN